MNVVNYLNVIKRAHDDFGYEIDKDETLEYLYDDAEKLILKNVKEPEDLYNMGPLEDNSVEDFFPFTDSDYSETIDVSPSLSCDKQKWNYYREVSENSFVKIDYYEVKPGDYFLAARIVDCKAKVLGLLFQLNDEPDSILVWNPLLGYWS